MPPTFEAKTRDQVKGIPEPAKPGDAIPSLEITGFGLDSAAGSALHRVFTYATRTHSIEELSTPHYFDAAREFGIQKWDVIHCTIGHDPASAIEVCLRVTDIGVGTRLPVVVTQGPVHHFGSANGKGK